jgi:hypothetical protein
MYQDYYWNGKLLVFTRHFKRELQALEKFEEFALYVLEQGNHKLVSKRQNKYNVLLQWRDGWICLSYALHDDVMIMIHVKPTGRLK